MLFLPIHFFTKICYCYICNSFVALTIPNIQGGKKEPISKILIWPPPLSPLLLRYKYKLLYALFKQILLSDEFCWTIIMFSFFHCLSKSGEWYRYRLFGSHWFCTVTEQTGKWHCVIPVSDKPLISKQVKMCTIYWTHDLLQLL